MTYRIERLRDQFAVRGSSLPGADFLQKLCDTEAEALAHIAKLEAEDAAWTGEQAFWSRVRLPQPD